jgi:hypothetical protein
MQGEAMWFVESRTRLSRLMEVGLTGVAWSQGPESLRLEIGLAKVNRGRHVKLRQGKVFLLNEIKREYQRNVAGLLGYTCRDVIDTEIVKSRPQKISKHGLHGR